eukprot:jgi/Botrbrau1/22796/Bobra.0132s0122.1
MIWKTFNESKASHKRMCTTVHVVPASDGNFPFRYYLQDSPSLTSKDDVDTLVRFLEDQIKEYSQTDFDVNRTTALAQLEDVRFDICLFFVLPHGLRPLEIMAMKEIAKLMPVIPLLSKADTLTISEVQTWSTTVRRELRTDSGTPIWDMSGGEVHGMWDMSLPPYTVIGSETTLDGVHVRPYPWGTVSTTESSDVLLLIHDVFVRGVQHLKNETDRRYYERRPSLHAALLARTSGEPAKSKASKTCVGRRVWIRSSSGAAKDSPEEPRRSNHGVRLHFILLLCSCFMKFEFDTSLVRSLKQFLDRACDFYYGVRPPPAPIAVVQPLTAASLAAKAMAAVPLLTGRLMVLALTALIMILGISCMCAVWIRSSSGAATRNLQSAPGPQLARRSLGAAPRALYKRQPLRASNAPWAIVASIIMPRKTSMPGAGAE